MNGLASLVIAISMYSRIPMPRIDWTKERMGYVMAWFPTVGVCLGAALFFLLAICEFLGISAGARSLLVTALPLLVTGGIHMDGFLDTTDARRSYGEREKKLEILKDPHVGAFAVIGCAGYLLLYAAVSLEAALGKSAFLLASAYVTERALSGLSVVFFPSAKKSGTAATFSDGAKRNAAAVSLSLWLIVGIFSAWMLSGSLFFAAGLIIVQGMVFFWYRRMAMREFGGVTGDLAGYFLQVCELASLIWIVVWQKTA